MSELIVIGHRNPDTDAICSALAYAEFKRLSGTPNAVAARCGDTNDRIDFVLRTFGVEAPKFVADVSPKVCDVMQTEVSTAALGTTVADALGLMDEHNIRVLPVLNADGTCKGLVSLFKLTKFYFPSVHRIFDSRRVLASLSAIADTLDGRLIHPVEADHEEDLILMIGAMSLEAFTQRLAKYPRERLLVVVGDRREIQDLAIRERVRALVLTGGLPVDQEVILQARQAGVSVILSPHDTATTATLSRAAIKVDHMIHEKFLAFDEDEPLDAARDLARESQFLAFPVLNNDKEIVGILTKSDFLKKVDRRLILVDHNELTQAVAGADKVEIVEVIDHHRIGAFTSHQPILFRNEPVGSTSTIVADCFLRQQIPISKSTAGLLLAGIVSDTLNLTSPTATPRDAEILRRLEAIAEVDATAFTEKLFASGSLLISKPAAQAITTDCKEYSEKDRSFSVAQIEEIGFDAFQRCKSEIRQALDEHCHRNQYFFAALLITDVVQQTSLLVLAGAEAFRKQIDYPEIEPSIYELAGVVSRKKQLLPYLTHCLQRVRT